VRSVIAGDRIVGLLRELNATFGLHYRFVSGMVEPKTSKEPPP
jgi:hypothetical protein